MDRAERTGFGVALGGHVALIALLSLGLVSTAKLPPMRTDPIDVQFVDEAARESASPSHAEAAPSEAPTVARPEAPPPPEPEPTPPKPEPKPAPPAPAPKPEKTIEKPAPKPAPPPKPAKPTPKPAAAPAPAATDDRPRRRPDHSEEGKAAPAKPARAAGTRLGPDFLKGLSDSAKGKAEAPKAAAVSALQLAGLGAAIRRQVQPCYELGSLQGTAAMSIVTTLDIRFNKDGTVAGTPSVLEQSGVNDDNRGYTRQIADIARRAVLRCATPIRLPPELYEGGWDEINLRFTPGQMQ